MYENLDLHVKNAENEKDIISKEIEQTCTLHNDDIESQKFIVDLRKLKTFEWIV